MLELCGQLPVACDSRPSVAKDFDRRLAKIDHRFDRKQHALFHLNAIALGTVVQDVGTLVEGPAKPVSAEISNDAASLAFGIRLNGSANGARSDTRLYRGNAELKALVRDVDQPLSASRDVTDGEHPAGVAMPAIDDQCDVNVDDIALAQWLWAWNAMADDVINRGADGLAETSVVEGCGNRLVCDCEIQCKVVERFRRHARHDVRGQHIERFCGQPPGLAHALEVITRIDFHPVRADSRGLRLTFLEHCLFSDQVSPGA